ncbi:MAG: hypothetical protein RMK29_16075 [Myxococcales bacterium]|nr:hypothetical protein [Myxococcota bacterium]MDW8283235.1 hypothetical protein [Myxococcales bacterium]
MDSVPCVEYQQQVVRSKPSGEVKKGVQEGRAMTYQQGEGSMLGLAVA